MKQERCDDKMLNYDLLMSIINEDRIIGEIENLMSARHGAQSLKQFLKSSYKQEYSDLMKSLSIIYIVYFLSVNESEVE